MYEDWVFGYENHEGYMREIKRVRRAIQDIVIKIGDFEAVKKEKRQEIQILRRRWKKVEAERKDRFCPKLF